MNFDDLLDRFWGYDFEVTAYDWLGKSCISQLSP